MVRDLEKNTPFVHDTKVVELLSERDDGSN
jgi:hypothetical protein